QGLGKAVDPAEADEADQEEQRGEADLDAQVLGGTELEVGLGELVLERGLALLDVALADPVRRRLEDARQALPEVGGGSFEARRGGTAGIDDAVFRQARLEI